MSSALPVDVVMRLATLDDLDIREALDALAVLIDEAADTDAPEVARRALAFANELERRELDEKDLALLDYFRANAWACIYAIRLNDRAAVWSWDQPELQAQILHLRRALRNSGFEGLHRIRRCQILTNLANQFDTAGRFVDAQEYWTRALAIMPEFWMARANRGRGLMHYAEALYDAGHRRVLAQHAHGDLLAACISADTNPELGDPSVAPRFAESAAQIGRAFDIEDIESSYDPDTPALDGTEDGSYRLWCLRHRLFLNPLNDVLARPIAARDVLHLPNFTTGFGEPPIVIGLFNQLKQEFVSARWLYYVGQSASEPHPSDREVLLYNTADYAVVGLAVEQVKSAFRMAYSIFDKIAFFLNHYLKLGMAPRNVTFQLLWRTEKNGPVRDLFEASENLALRGLFWISKDLYEPDVRDVAEPDAEALAELRNHLEHRYVKVHEMGIPTRYRYESERDPLFDDLAYAITRGDLQAKTLRVLKLARSALIYLSLAMHREERQRAIRSSTDRMTMPMRMSVISDDLKC